MVEVKIPGNNADVILKDQNGNQVPCIVKAFDDGSITISFEAQDVPTMGYTIYKAIARQAEEKVNAVSDIRVTASTMENKYFHIEIDPQGNMTRVYDKAAGRDVLPENGYGNMLQIFEDKPEGESAWNIDLEYQKKCWNINEVKSIEVMEVTPVRGVLRIVKTFNKSEIIQDITIYSLIPRIDFYTKVEWQETEKLLKAAFKVDVLSPEATYEIAFGSIQRPTHWNTSWDKARFEVPAYKWADLSESGYGVSILNDSKYGYDIKDNVMRITLLRAPISPDPVADKGYHEFVYSLYPHQGDCKQGHVVQAGYNVNVLFKTRSC